MKRTKIVVALITHENDFQLEQASVAEDVARRLDLDVEIIYADNDSVNQSLQLLGLIQDRSASRPDGIIVEPVGTGMPQVAQAAATAGIGWAVINRNVDYLTALRAKSSVPMFSVSTDNQEVGRIQGKQFNMLLPQGGCVLCVDGSSTSEVAHLRTSGMMSAKHTNITVKTLRGDWTEASGFNAVSSWLRLPTSRELHVGIVGCQNDAMAVGARRAIQELSPGDERDRLLKLPFTGCDGVSNKGQEYVRRKLLAATVVTPPLTGPALEMMVEAARTGRHPVEHTVIPSVSFPAIEQLRRST